MRERQILGIIAADLNCVLEARRVCGLPGEASPRVIARGAGWTVADVMCTFGPHDRRFEEMHSQAVIAVVAAGAFQYRSPSTGGNQLMTAGSLLLGNPGQSFECVHECGEGDRCLSFWFER